MLVMIGSAVSHILAEARLMSDARFVSDPRRIPDPRLVSGPRPATHARLPEGPRPTSDARLTRGEESAAAAGVRIARDHCARLTLAHVLPETPPEVPGAIADPPLLEARLARRRAVFDRLVALHPHEARRNWLVLDGEPGVEIVQAAIRHAVDLILLDGARTSPGAAPEESAVARYVIDRAPCRVELVGAGATTACPCG